MAELARTDNSKRSLESEARGGCLRQQEEDTRWNIMSHWAERISSELRPYGAVEIRLLLLFFYY